MPNAHIIPSDDRWNVKQENGDVVSTHDTQAEANKAAKDWARSHGGGEVFTHRDEGEFSAFAKATQSERLGGVSAGPDLGGARSRRARNSGASSCR